MVLCNAVTNVHCMNARTPTNSTAIAHQSERLRQNQNLTGLFKLTLTSDSRNCQAACACSAPASVHSVKTEATPDHAQNLWLRASAAGIAVTHGY